MSCSNFGSMPCRQVFFFVSSVMLVRCPSIPHSWNAVAQSCRSLSSASLDPNGCMSNKARQVANKDVGSDLYCKAISLWLNEPPTVEVMTKIGPTVCKDLRQVTPGCFMSVRTLCNDLILIGLQNGCIQKTRFQEGCYKALRDNTAMVGTCNTDKVVEDFFVHMQTVMSMLRTCKLEDQSSTSAFRRYPRSGGFRKKCAVAQTWSMVAELLDKMECPSDAAEAVQGM